MVECTLATRPTDPAAGELRCRERATQPRLRLRLGADAASLRDTQAVDSALAEVG